jgi:uncharacterized protein
LPSGGPAGDVLKASRFNITTRLSDGTSLLFNFATLALVALEGRGAQRAGRILDDPVGQSMVPGHRRLARLLASHGFLVPCDDDELGRLEAGFREQKTVSRTLSLTVAPTLACNFDCSYCCEGRVHRGRMGAHVERALTDFVGARLPTDGALDVTWYGGEPLLAKDVIERLSHRFHALCQERRARYDATIITNGYLLDAATAHWLQQLGVKNAQVTLDGPADVHDRRRPLASGGRTFDRILANLASAVHALTISVRTNLDGDNLSSVGSLLDALVAADLADRVSHYTAPVTSLSAGCCDGSGRCLDTKAFSLVALETSLQRTRRALPDGSRPRFVNGPCGATRANSFVVSPDGGLVTCWEEVGRPDRYVAHLLEAETECMASNRRSWLEYDPFSLECRDCRVLPICMSYCPYRVRAEATLPCPGWKHHPDEYLLNEYRLRELDREQEVVIGLAELKDALRAAARRRNATDATAS